MKNVSVLQRNCIFSLVPALLREVNFGKSSNVLKHKPRRVHIRSDYQCVIKPRR